jgi:putative ABC transport system permease protein
MPGNFFAMNELRFACRHLLKSPAFTGAALITLALGIGANSALFSVLYAVLFEPLPYPESDRLVQVQSVVLSPGKAPQAIAYWSHPRFELLRDQNRIFSHLAAYHGSALRVSAAGPAERLQGEAVSHSYFPMLGVRPVLGRWFLPEEDRKGAAEQVVIISAGMWHRHYGGDARVIGRTLRVNEIEVTIVGVLPVGFRGLSEEAELWVPMALVPVLEENPERLNRPFTMWHRVAGRLNPSVTMAAAGSSLMALDEQLNAALPMPGTDVWQLRLRSLREAATDPVIRRSLLVLAGAVGFVLLIACVNVANLLLARAATRQKETAIRVALGATRMQLLRQLLTENLVLALLAGGLALLVARWTVNLMAAFQPANEFALFAQYARLPDLGTIPLHAPVLAFTFLLALGCGLVFGIIPVLRPVRGSVRDSLQGAVTRPAQHADRLWFGGGHGLLIVAETALTMMLLVGAGLMIHSFSRLTTTRIGFEPQSLLTFRLDEPRDASAAKGELFFDQVTGRIGVIPGVESVCLAEAAPLSGTYDRSFMLIQPGGAEQTPVEVLIGIHPASEEYLRTLQVPLLGGRWFNEQDRRDTKLVAVINQTAAQRYWPSTSPIGQSLDLSPALSNPYSAVEVVGVIGDVKYDNMAAEPSPNVYLSHRQRPCSSVYLTLRTQIDPLLLVDEVRAAVAAENPAVPLYDLMTMEQRIRNSISRARFNALLLVAFAGLAVVLAAVGLYGVLAYSVLQRTREIGLRMALGARATDVLQLMISQGMRLVAVGIMLGLAGALVLTRLMRSLLYEIPPTDPVTFAGVTLLFVFLAFLACYLPARRAARVDPLVALRQD